MNRINKKTMVKVISVFTILLLLISCRKDDTSAKPKIDKIQFAESKKEMAVGERATIGVTITPKEARQDAQVY